MTTMRTLAVLADIFGNMDVPEKVAVAVDPVSRDVTITYVDMDFEWFRELTEAMKESER